MNKLLVLVLIALAYGLGRLHQWYRHTNCNEGHYRRGYDDGAETFLERAVRAVQAVQGQTTRFLGIARVNGSTKRLDGARHSTEDRGAKTTRINTRGSQDA